jgi:hypothetical protein
LLGSKRNRR